MASEAAMSDSMAEKRGIELARWEIEYFVFM